MKHRYDRPLRRNSKEITFARQYLKENGITYRFRWGGVYGGGYAIPNKSHVQIYMTVGGDEQGDRVPVTARYFLSSLFHEASHVFNHRAGKYAVYHNGKHRMTTPELKTMIRTALAAEVYTDTQAKKLMKKYYPNIPYLGGYDGEWLRKRFKKGFVAHFKKRLETRLKRTA